MKLFRLLTTLSALLLLFSCSKGKGDYDATGSFEATEIIVSSQANGRILELGLNEGDQLEQGQEVGLIDSTQLSSSAWPPRSWTPPRTPALP